MSETVSSPKTWDAEIELPEPRKNKPVTLQRRIEAFFFIGLLKILRLFSIESGSAFLGRTMRYLGPLLHTVHQRGERNLKLIYPDMTPAERSAILRDVWENAGRTAAEYAHYEKLAGRVTLENAEGMQRFAEEGQQAIFVSGHFANWEAMGCTIKREGVKFAVVYRAPNNALVDKHIIDLRAVGVSRLQIPKGKRGGRELMGALKDGHSISMLVDQKLNDGIEVPLLGYPAMTPPAAARLAKKFGLPIVPLQLIRRPGVRFVLTVHNPIMPDEGSTEELTARINEVLGDFILARPEQWLWLHRRWPKEVTPV
ncbi:lysophospholipid acyltransferase family protein [Parvularcula maris]|uniref:Lysophospholipid acyltransferase family protein n=1 Tax=Parvularcula maris TaxID=2965077 RepID=A0A9X2L8I7_9PROT|nr:lysophospholipid acyltransferase family protein [Parvularcula maris]MCQ8184931.1 lysophospholipid acyltransferase family protein [Parvularcula maris]